MLQFHSHFVDLSLLTVSLSGWALVLRSFGLGGRMASTPPDGAGPIVPQKGSILNSLTRPTVPSNNSSPPTVLALGAHNIHLRLGLLLRGREAGQLAVRDVGRGAKATANRMTPVVVAHKDVQEDGACGGGAGDDWSELGRE